MKEEFNCEEARRFLLAREEIEKSQKELVRKQVLQKVMTIIQNEFKGSEVEVYLVGSITKPQAFSSHSDVDVVLKNYRGDRFDFWVKLEAEIGREVEVILFERCRFQEFVIKEGLKVV